MKKVSVSSLVGKKSSEVSSSGCYITIPSLYDVNDNPNSVYFSEVYDANGTISFMSGENGSNGASNRRRAFDGGDYNDYWLRSPSIPDYSNTDYYVWRVDKNGTFQEISAPSNNDYGVLIEISF